MIAALVELFSSVVKINNASMGESLKEIFLEDHYFCYQFFLGETKFHNIKQSSN